MNIAHRDIKGANILISEKGQVQITDFGLARILNPKNKNAQYTSRVITLWYRAPEVLLGFANYTFAVDMWSIGCVFVELITGQVLFRAGQELQAMDLIFQICGSPTEQTMPGVEKQKNYQEFR
jgi:cyclin-dependent kinase 12/13